MIRKEPAGMKALLVTLTLALMVLEGMSRVAADPIEFALHQGETGASFQEFVREHSKKYEGREFELRSQIFAENLRRIQMHNGVRSNTWKMAVNKFSDLTDEEFRTTFSSGYVSPRGTAGEGSPARMVVPSEVVGKVDLPESVDWRLMGAVTEVKYQAKCGSCWAFTAVEQLESYLKIDSDYELPVLSPQQVLACSPRDLACGGPGGCSGSIPQLAFAYAQLYGVTSEDRYPYSATDKDGCLFNPDLHPTKVFGKGYEVLPHNDQDAVMRHLATRGPLAVAVDASAWKFYTSGVFDGCDYGKNINLNHAVQLVGYGTEGGLDYWLIRNSWGLDWGEAGYIKLKREKQVQCGLDSTPLAGVGCVGDGNDVQKVCGMCGVLFDTSYPISVGPTSGILNNL